MSKESNPEPGPNQIKTPAPQGPPKAEAEWLRDMQVMKLEPGDVIVLGCSCILSDEHHKVIKGNIQNMFPDNRCLILEEGMDIGVVSKQTEEDAKDEIVLMQGELGTVGVAAKGCEAIEHETVDKIKLYCTQEDENRKKLIRSLGKEIKVIIKTTDNSQS